MRAECAMDDAAGGAGGAGDAGGPGDAGGAGDAAGRTDASTAAAETTVADAAKDAAAALKTFLAGGEFLRRREMRADVAAYKIVVNGDGSTLEENQFGVV